MTGLVAFAGILVLSSAFILAHFGRRFTVRIKRRWRALSAGVGVAYVFVNVLPELEEHRPIVAGSAMGSVLDAEKRIYLWALAGFVAFAALSRVQLIKHENHEENSGSGVYWCAMAGWALYMLLIGYLLVHREDHSIVSLWLFVFAMGLHIFMLDNELVEQFEGMYEPWGRALLVSAVLLGWALGMADALPDSFTSRLFAFVVGGVVITSAHEEAAMEETGRLWWFAGGAGLYAVLLMLI